MTKPKKFRCPDISVTCDDVRHRMSCQTLLDGMLAIKAIPKNGFYDRGICGAFSDHTSRDYPWEILEVLFKDWPKHSGNNQYPVPHPYESPRWAYDCCLKWSGKYGSNRKELLDYCIKLLQDRIKAAKIRQGFTA